MSTVAELIVDAYGCRLELSDPKPLEKAARCAIEKIGATVVESASHRFQPHGLTLCLILKESHFIVSTWPEFDLAIVNIFLCNEAMDPKNLWEEFQQALGPTHCVFHEVKHEINRKLKKVQKRA